MRRIVKKYLVKKYITPSFIDMDQLKIEIQNPERAKLLLISEQIIVKGMDSKKVIIFYRISIT